MPAATTARRTSRFWLYAPFVLLALLAAGWSGLWVVARGKVEQHLEAGIAREANAGRNWTCRDRSVGGYPFRIEVRCAGVTLVSSRWGDEVRLEAGPTVAVAQASTPGHLILQVAGPLTATLPAGRNADLAWSRFEASLRLTTTGFERLSVVLNDPVATLRTPDQADGSLRSESMRSALFEAHLRPNQQGFASQQAFDVALSTKGTVMALLDGLLGDAAPGDLDVQATVSQALAFRRGFNHDALESWRAAGGGVEITKLGLTKGTARLDASGRIGLDDAHRPAGQLDAAVAGIERIAGIRVGGGLTAGLGALLGGRSGAQKSNAAAGLTPLPPVVLREGRVYLGPLRLPLQPLRPLY
ncbi:DUF2125 domain-containing protein [Bosea sp. (in: a-proteobacteria)]|uniref:DUF2125 domain-containing protein n=1 Tax=Bosea sp. (in: a-proteobacteria) TaxID=1871050 RepID=UPI002FCAD304